MVRTAEPPLFWEDPDEMARKTALIVREVLEGKTNNVREVSLRPGETTTEVLGERICCDTVPLLVARTAAAAGSLASGMVWVESTAGRVVIHHDASDSEDRKLGIVLVG